VLRASINRRATIIWAIGQREARPPSCMHGLQVQVIVHNFPRPPAQRTTSSTDIHQALKPACSLANRVSAPLAACCPAGAESLWKRQVQGSMPASAPMPLLIAAAAASACPTICSRYPIASRDRRRQHGQSKEDQEVCRGQAHAQSQRYQAVSCCCLSSTALPAWCKLDAAACLHHSPPSSHDVNPYCRPKPVKKEEDEVRHV
jgi:hypothetical protein